VAQWRGTYDRRKEAGILRLHLHDAAGGEEVPGVSLDLPQRKSYLIRRDTLSTVGDRAYYIEHDMWARLTKLLKHSLIIRTSIYSCRDFRRVGSVPKAIIETRVRLEPNGSGLNADWKRLVS
jgi:hypothetical protein